MPAGANMASVNQQPNLVNLTCVRQLTVKGLPGVLPMGNGTGTMILGGWGFCLYSFRRYQFELVKVQKVIVSIVCICVAGVQHLTFKGCLNCIFTQVHDTSAQLNKANNYKSLVSTQKSSLTEVVIYCPACWYPAKCYTVANKSDEQYFQPSRPRPVQSPVGSHSSIVVYSTQQNC